MLRKIIVSFLLIATLCSMFALPASAATVTITASNEKYPTTLTKGSSFGIYGTYKTSAGNITSVSASLTYPNGSTSYFWSAAPGTKTFDVRTTKGSNNKTLNSTLTFGSLSAGAHTLKIVITAKSGSTTNSYTVNKKFTITEPASSTPAAPKITITTAEKFPTELTKGSNFGIYGAYKTNVGKITSVSASLTYPNGSTSYFWSAAPGTKTFDVRSTKGSNDKTLNSTLTFGSLSAGAHTLKVVITAKNGTATTTHTVTKKFTIIDPAPAVPKISITTAEKFPTELTKGSNFGIYGAYKTSAGNITSVSASLTYPNGSTSYFWSAAPGTKTFDVRTTKGSNNKTLNSTLTFGSLSAGAHTLKIVITAKNGTATTTHTVTKKFTIIDPAPAVPKISITTAEKFPTELTKGSNFGIYGAYKTSVGQFTSVSASLTYPNGSTSYFWSAAPGNDSFDVRTTAGSNGKSLNSTLTFGSLSAGTHTLNIVITAKNGTATTTHTVTKKFTIIDPASAKPQITISSTESYPSELTQGHSFGISGVYTTDVGTITKVTASLAYPDGSKKEIFSAAPNAQSFDVRTTTGSNGKTLNNTLVFGELSTGAHTLYIDITAQNGTANTTYTAVKPFTIMAPNVYTDFSSLPQSALNRFLELMNNNSDKTFTLGVNSNTNGVYCFGFADPTTGVTYFIAESAFFPKAGQHDEQLQFSHGASNFATLSSTCASTYVLRRSSEAADSSIVRFMKMDHMVIDCGADQFRIEGSVSISLKLTYDANAHTLKVLDTHSCGIYVKPTYTVKTTNYNSIGFTRFDGEALGVAGESTIDIVKLLKLVINTGIHLYTANIKEILKDGIKAYQLSENAGENISSKYTLTGQSLVYINDDKIAEYSSSFQHTAPCFLKNKGDYFTIKLFCGTPPTAENPEVMSKKNLKGSFSVEDIFAG